MHLSSTLAAAVALPLASAQLNQLAQKAGKLYFGTATDNGELNNTEYVSILTDTKEFGQLTPANGMKVRCDPTPPPLLPNVLDGILTTTSGNLLSPSTTSSTSPMAPSLPTSRPRTSSSSAATT
jgi:hypothetical protein